MPRAFLKRFLMCLVLVALAVVPWAQAFAQNSVRHCGISATETTALVGASFQQGPHERGAANAITADCTTSCIAPLAVAAPVMVAGPVAWTPVRAPAVVSALVGRSLEPELAPPIA
jgi:hypothetical protein